MARILKFKRHVVSFESYHLYTLQSYEFSPFGLEDIKITYNMSAALESAKAPLIRTTFISLWEYILLEKNGTARWRIEQLLRFMYMQIFRCGFLSTRVQGVKLYPAVI